MTEAYSQNPLATEIYGAMRSAGFGDQFNTVPIANEEIIEQIKASKLKGVDYRAKVKAEPGFASVFDGLAFDPENLRSQSTAIYHDEKPIGLMTQVIAPRKWIESQRYFERDTDGVYVRDFESVSKNGMADFLVIPAWTILDSEYRYPKTIISPGFQAFQNIMKLIQTNAPQNTYMEAIAQGQFPFDRKGELQALADRGVNVFIPQSELLFSLDLIGKNNGGSMASVNMAERMRLERVDGLGSGLTLGPVFARKLK